MHAYVSVYYPWHRCSPETLQALELRRCGTWTRTGRATQGSARRTGAPKGVGVYARTPKRLLPADLEREWRSGCAETHIAAAGTRSLASRLQLVPRALRGAAPGASGISCRFADRNFFQVLRIFVYCTLAIHNVTKRTNYLRIPTYTL